LRTCSGITVPHTGTLLLGIPPHAGLIQRPVVAWIYIALELTVPALLYTAINYTASLQSMMVRKVVKCSTANFYMD